MSIRVCQVVPSINQLTGGTAFAVTNLAEALARQGIKSHVFTLDYSTRGEQLKSDGINLHSQSANLLTRSLRGWSPQAQDALHQLAKEFDIIHSHGMWMFPNVYARQAAVQNNLPFVLSTHGMVESWSLNYSRVRKKLAWNLYEKQNLKQATLFHATSKIERHSLQSLNLKQPIATIPLGVKFPSVSDRINRTVLIERFPQLHNKKWLLFLSRIHPKKGLEILIKVWADLINIFPDWHLIIAGSDSIGYQVKIVKLVESLGINKYVTFTGMLVDIYREAALANADLFVLPTYSENFGIVVAESLARGVPVITTKEAPWQDLQTYRCGWWIDCTSQALTEALIAGINMSSEERQNMGKRGEQLVVNRYSWNAVAEKMEHVYNWLLNGGNSPECIHHSIPL
jgi:glycosyltransferase involved in cell wall biosynthesis